jgi:hypothetical protein
MHKRVGSSLATRFDSKAGGGGSLSASLRHDGWQILAEAGEGKRGKKWWGALVWCTLWTGRGWPGVAHVTVEGGADVGRTQRLSGSVDRGMGWRAWATHGERGPTGGEGKWLGPGKSGIFDLFK